jgi:nitroreductase
VGRWTGSASNTQPWRFIVIRDQSVLRRLFEVGQPQTRALRTATAAIAVVLPVRDERAVGDAYEDGRAAERLLIAASMLGLGAGIQWVRDDVLEPVRELLGLPPDRRVLTIIALGHPTDAARLPKAAPGEARLPRDEVVFRERWPG